MKDSAVTTRTPTVAAGVLAQPGAQTLFERAPAPAPRAGTSLARALPAAPPAVRVGEYLAAPFVDLPGGPRPAGRIVGSSEVPGIPLTEAARHMGLRERIFIVPPQGRTATPGDRYISFALSRAIDGLGHVFVPTGVIVVDRAEQGQAAEARVVAVYGEISMAQGLVPLEINLPDSLARLRLVQNGAESHIVWISGGDPPLPTIQNYVVLDGGVNRGVQPGDQISFIRPRRTTDDGVVLPESEIGIARVVRVSQTTATAIVVRQTHPAIHLGTLARVTAKLP